MATETKEEKIPEAVESEDGVVVAKETEKKEEEAPVSDDGDSEEEEKTVTGTPVTERPKRIIKKVEPHILLTPSRSRSKPVSVQQVQSLNPSSLTEFFL